MADIPTTNSLKTLLMIILKYKKLLMFIGLLISPYSMADVVKPALIEILADTQGSVTIEAKISIEALLTGINSQYKNTKNAPTAKEYDELRRLKPEALKLKFQKFQADFLTAIALKADEKAILLSVIKTKIPQVGYPKVPRISTVYLAGDISPYTKNLQWYYPNKFGDNVVRVKQVNQKEEKWAWSDWQWLKSDQASTLFPLTKLFTKEPIWHTIINYIELGVSHIIPKGLDHILFILGLFLLSTSLQVLLTQVTMFTVAHTLTLGLAMNGVIEAPAVIVEPLIALSIAYVGIENIFSRKLHTHRLVLIFAFGLLHGLGFASVLADFGPPDSAFITALISFNIGVEIGQLLVISLAFICLSLWLRKYPWYHKAVAIPLSLAIAITGTYWALDRALLL